MKFHEHGIKVKIRLLEVSINEVGIVIEIRCGVMPE